MTNPEVYCSVSECRYNEQSKHCHAGRIQVTKHHSTATNMEATDCATFEAR